MPESRDQELRRLIREQAEDAKCEFVTCEEEQRWDATPAPEPEDDPPQTWDGLLAWLPEVKRSTRAAGRLTLIRQIAPAYQALSASKKDRSMVLARIRAQDGEWWATILDTYLSTWSTIRTAELLDLPQKRVWKTIKEIGAKEPMVDATRMQMQHRRKKAKRGSTAP